MSPEELEKGDSTGMSCWYLVNGLLGGGFKHFLFSPRKLGFHDPI